MNSDYSKTKEELRKRLTPLAYQVTQEDGTEPAFKNPYHDLDEPGLYVDIVSGEALFSSIDKFNSGCGWPSFAKPLSILQEKKDSRLGLIRVEVRSVKANSHLGHVFNDGPNRLGGLRYCINSAALRFIPMKEMEEAGYGKYLYLFENLELNKKAI